MNNDQLSQLDDDQLEQISGGNGQSSPPPAPCCKHGGLDLNLALKLDVKLDLGLGTKLLGSAC